MHLDYKIKLLSCINALGWLYTGGQTFPDRHFPTGHFPIDISRFRHIPMGQFPMGHFPTWTFPDRDISRPVVWASSKMIIKWVLNCSAYWYTLADICWWEKLTNLNMALTMGPLNKSQMQLCTSTLFLPKTLCSRCVLFGEQLQHSVQPPNTLSLLLHDLKTYILHR